MLPAYLIWCSCFISRRKPARENKNVCNWHRDVRGCMCALDVARMYVFHEWERDRTRGRLCANKRRKTLDRETEREREMYARFYGIGGTPELRARRRFVLSPFAPSPFLRRTFALPYLPSLSLFPLLPYSLALSAPMCVRRANV